MTTPLPDWQDPVASVPDLLAAAERRLQQLRRIDPHGGFEAPSFELTSRAQAFTVLALAILILATIVTVCFTRGPVFLVLGGVTAALFVYVYLGIRATNRYVARWRSEGVVAMAAVVMANGRLFEPGSSMLPGTVVFSFDARLGASADDLVRLAERLFELKAADPSQLPPDVAELAQRLQSEIPTWRRQRVPAQLCGNDATWIADVAFDRKRLPHGVLDRRLWPMLVHRTLERDTTALLPLQVWWREDLDDWSRSLGQQEDD